MIDRRHFLSWIIAAPAIVDHFALSSINTSDIIDLRGSSLTPEVLHQAAGVIRKSAGFRPMQFHIPQFAGRHASRGRP